MLKTIVIKLLLSGTNVIQMLHTCSLFLIQSLIIGFFSVHQCKFELDAEWEFGSKNSTQQTKYIVFYWILLLLHWTQNHIIIRYPVCQIQKLNVKAERCTAHAKLYSCSISEVMWFDTCEHLRVSKLICVRIMWHPSISLSCAFIMLAGCFWHIQWFDKCPSEV